MILPLPYNTDAPIYHWPFATVGLIAVNSMVFFATMSDPALVEPLILRYGEINPVQWITSNFAHADFFHLLGNMLFLWAFGLVVEGKLGWWRYLLVFLGIGIVQCAVEQMVTLGMDFGGSLGASSIIFGLMVISMVWAPLNEMSCFVFFWYIHVFEMRIMALGAIYLVYNVVTGALIQWAMSGSYGVVITSQVLHLMGGAVGFAVGVIFLKRGWVDCEHWDLFSVMKGHHRLSRDERAELGLPDRRRKAEPDVRLKPQPQVQQPLLTADSALTQIRDAIALGNPEAAYQIHRQASNQVLQWELPEDVFIRLLDSFQQQQKWLESVPAMLDYLKTHKRHADTVRLKLAAVFVQFANQSWQAIQVLDQINTLQLTAEQQAVYQNLRQKAQELT